MSYTNISKPMSVSYSSLTKPSATRPLHIDDLGEKSSTIDGLDNMCGTIDELICEVSFYNKISKPTL